MLLRGYPDPAVLDQQFEHRDPFVAHELSRHGAAHQVREPLIGTKQNLYRDRPSPSMIHSMPAG